jgi:hypothetical protein
MIPRGRGNHTQALLFVTEEQECIAGPPFLETARSLQILELAIDSQACGLGKRSRRRAR